MSTKKQMEIPGVDDTPLAEALTALADIQNEIEKLEADKNPAAVKVLEEMEKIGKKKMSAHGFKFSIKVTEESKKLKISKEV